MHLIIVGSRMFPSMRAVKMYTPWGKTVVKSPLLCHALPLACGSTTVVPNICIYLLSDNTYYTYKWHSWSLIGYLNHVLFCLELNIQIRIIKCGSIGSLLAMHWWMQFRTPNCSCFATRDETVLIYSLVFLVFSLCIIRFFCEILLLWYYNVDHQPYYVSSMFHLKHKWQTHSTHVGCRYPAGSLRENLRFFRMKMTLTFRCSEALMIYLSLCTIRLYPVPVGFERGLRLW